MAFRKIAFLVVLASVLVGCGPKTVREVDSKYELPVPNSTVICYFVEIETRKGDKEIAEESKCVPKAIYDKQNESEPFRP